MRNISPLPKQGFRDFDLPVEHLMPERHYIPPMTHDHAEAARRRDLNSGTLRYEMQHRGLHVARVILEHITEEEARLYATDMIALAGLNSAWYSYAQNRKDIMRRRLKLPQMMHPRMRIKSTVYDDASEILEKAEARALKLVEAHEYLPEKVTQRQKEVGVSVGNCALLLLMYGPVVRGEFPDPLYEEDIESSEVEMQAKARLYANDALSRSRDIHRVMGSHPSIAQFSDPYSHLSVYWYRNAPGSAQRAIQEALLS